VHSSVCIPLFAYPPQVRRIIYTTNAIESLHSQVRRSVRAVASRATGGGEVDPGTAAPNPVSTKSGNDPDALPLPATGLSSS
jgi:hypothetical protein